MTPARIRLPQRLVVSDYHRGDFGFADTLSDEFTRVLGGELRKRTT
ncbi:MAG: hypothetical protein QOG38_2674, partial [Hyphomicrobiales bacterium]|nr:hypothetical protein [Hyphomicrobiales bacterium]